MWKTLLLLFVVSAVGCSSDAFESTLRSHEESQEIAIATAEKSLEQNLIDVDGILQFEELGAKRIDTVPNLFFHLSSRIVFDEEDLLKLGWYEDKDDLPEVFRSRLHLLPDDAAWIRNQNRSEMLATFQTVLQSLCPYVDPAMISSVDPRLKLEGCGVSVPQEAYRKRIHELWIVSQLAEAALYHNVIQTRQERVPVLIRRSVEIQHFAESWEEFMDLMENTVPTIERVYPKTSETSQLNAIAEALRVSSNASTALATADQPAIAKLLQPLWEALRSGAVTPQIALRKQYVQHLFRNILEGTKRLQKIDPVGFVLEEEQICAWLSELSDGENIEICL